MTPRPSADVVVVGSGVAGLLVARELARRGREVEVLERGTLRPHAEQVRHGAHAELGPTSAHNHEPHPDTPGDPWQYVFGVGGAGLHWGGVTPRLQPSDFELRSRYGVGRDWPLAYDDLAPYYEEAEAALGVAGGPNAAFGAAYRPPLPPHPFSPVDRMLRGPLAPYHALPQARATRPRGGRPACCGAGRCNLCPVDARFTPLHLLDDGLAELPAFRLRSGCLVAALRRDGNRWRLDCRQASGEQLALGARTVVLAANGFENAAILLRSGLGGEEVGRWLYDHVYASFDLELRRPFAAGVGDTIATGISYAWADGDWRARRGSQLVVPDNRGALYADDWVDLITAGRRGRSLAAAVRERYGRRLRVDVSGEDLPQEGRRVELSPRRDANGLPLNRIRYPGDSDYLQRSRAVIRRELEERLAPLGARIVRERSYGGGHQLGTCRMGSADGVVDPHLELRGAPGIHVVGGSAFPAYSAAQPTLTVAALAIRLGRRLVDDAP